MALPALGFDNFYSSTLSGAISASDTVIPVNTVPTASVGYLVIDQDNASKEIIYYTSKGASSVTCPSAAAGRGVGGTTAVSHSSGATIKSNVVAEHFEALQDASALTGLHTYFNNGFYDYVESGCVWTGDSLGSTKAASMTSGVVVINGRRLTVAAVSARTFTASKDTYVDLLLTSTSEAATIVYTEVTNNAASPALASDSIRIAIIVTDATDIQDAGSINQGEPTKVLPIASSIPYQVTDSLGNLICNRNPSPGLIGYRQITSAFTTTTTPDYVDVTGLSVPVIVPSGRTKIRVKFFIGRFVGNGNAYTQAVREGSTSLTQLVCAHSISTQSTMEDVLSVSAGSHTYKASVAQNAAGTITIGAGAGGAVATNGVAYLAVELV